MRYHGDARVLNVALSRMLRKEPEVLAALPKCAVVAPSAGGIPVAFGIREALDADQIFWAEKNKQGEYHFRQYFDVKGLKCLLVDDMVRSGAVMSRVVNFIREAGAEVVACGSLVRFLKVCHAPASAAISADGSPVGRRPSGRCRLAV